MGGKAGYMGMDTIKLADTVVGAYGNFHLTVSTFSVKWESRSSAKSRERSNHRLSRKVEM